MNESAKPTAFFYSAPAEWFVRVAHELAVAGVRRLALSDGQINEVLVKPALRDEYLKAANSAGLAFTDAHAPYGRFSDLEVPDESHRPLMLRRQKAAMQVAADMGCSTTVIHVGTNNFPGVALDRYRECAKRSLDALLPVAEKLKLVICIENVWFPSTTPENLLSLLADFPSEHLGICYDSGHANLMARGEGLADARAVRDAWKEFGPVGWDAGILEKLLPHVVVCHLHDNDGRTDEHLLPGRGTLDWSHIMSLLDKAPKLRSIQAELKMAEFDGGMKVCVDCFASLLRTGKPVA